MDGSACKASQYSFGVRLDPRSARPNARAPMEAIILDGKAEAAAIRSKLAGEVAAFVAAHGRPPSLHVILAGDDPASAVYVKSKEKAANEIGMHGALHRLAADVAQDALVSLIRKLAEDDGVDGILVQLPLPKHLDEKVILDLVPPSKDVDGFHPFNSGLLASGRPGLVPCTPLGCMHLIGVANAKLGIASLAGARAVVVGRSNIVGKPVAQLLLAQNATVTIAHSRTRDLPALCREADVLVAAVGKAEMLDDRHVKQGAIVIDVGINRVALEGNPKGKLVGDVAFEKAKSKASAITPVPGGVGPLTIAFLLANTLQAARARLAASSN
jgi:methylenetetrahydrofolate dehydrogenase (NADP+) / methenyltetrahydrofolate cyclohydrolase